MSALCPNCGSDQHIRKGTRTNISGTKPIFLCKRCSRRFVSEPSNRYPRHLIVHVLNSYTMGSSQSKIISDLRRRYRSYPSRTTIQRWLFEHKDICLMRKYRNALKHQDEVIRELSLVHRGIPYRFGTNLFKLNFLAGDMVRLKDYLLDIRDSHLFDEGPRCSEVGLDMDVDIVRTTNIACRYANVGFLAARTSNERHPMVENLMLVNDLATIAKEVPINFHLDGIGNITGHIDILQQRFGRIHILDIKPDAEREQPGPQLLLYALGLSRSTGIPLSSMECAWFDDKHYFRFEPSKAKWSTK